MFNLRRRKPPTTTNDDYENMYSEASFGHPSLNILLEKRALARIESIDTIVLEKLPVSMLNQVSNLIKKTITRRK